MCNFSKRKDKIHTIIPIDAKSLWKKFNTLIIKYHYKLGIDRMFFSKNTHTHKQNP